MTGLDLAALAASLDADAAMDALLELDETSRRALAPVALELHRAARRTRREQLAAVGGHGSVFRWPDIQCEDVILACCANRSELRAARPMVTPERLLRIMQERRPEWLQGWFEDQFPAGLAGRWELVDRFCASGLAQITAPVAAALPGTASMYALRRDGEGLLELLRARPWIWSSLWLLFEVEGAGESSLASADKYLGRDGWSKALRALGDDGTLERSRLLDASLVAASSGFAEYRAGWFLRFHEALVPSDAERQQRAGLYLALAGSPQGPSRSFALKAITRLERAGAIDDAALVEALPALLDSRATSTVTGALKLLDRAAQRSSPLAASVALAAARATAHEAVDVQRLALGIAQRHGAGDADVTDELAATAPLIAPSLRAGVTGPGSPDNVNALVADDALGERVDRLPEDIRRLAGIGLELAPFDRIDIPCLSSDTRIEAIDDVEALIDAAARALEHPGRIDELERVLDGIARFGDIDPGSPAAPLQARAVVLLERSQDEPARSLAEAILAWLADAPAARPAARPGCTSTLSFLRARALLVADRAAESMAWTPLSTPTHSGGYIDPVVLVDRAARHPDPPPHDAILALLRLAPDGRARALEQARAVPGEFGRALRHALGSSAETVGRDMPLWVAAARARAPRADDEAVANEHRQPWPDAARAASTTINVVVAHGFLRYLRVRAQEDAPCSELGPLTPTVSARHVCATPNGERRCGTGARTAAALGWCATIWPLNLDAFFEEGIAAISYNLDWHTALWENRTYLEPLLDPDTPFSRAALVLVALGLAAKDPTEQALAVDALETALVDGRTNGSALGAEIDWLVREQIAAPARLAKTLTRLAGASDLHAREVADAIERLIRFDAARPPSGFHALLGLLLELRSATATAVSDPRAIACLSALTGSSKVATHGRALLALAPGSTTAESGPRERLRWRVERAERWLTDPAPRER